MKVKELITLLEKQDSDMRVVVDGYESGYDELHTLELIHLGKFRGDNPDKPWYDGEFDWVYDKSKADEIAILFPRGGKKI